MLTFYFQIVELNKETFLISVSEAFRTVYQRTDIQTGGGVVDTLFELAIGWGAPTLGGNFTADRVVFPYNGKPASVSRDTILVASISPIIVGHAGTVPNKLL